VYSTESKIIHCYYFAYVLMGTSLCEKRGNETDLKKKIKNFLLYKYEYCTYSLSLWSYSSYPIRPLHHNLTRKKHGVQEHWICGPGSCIYPYTLALSLPTGLRYPATKRGKTHISILGFVFDISIDLRLAVFDWRFSIGSFRLAVFDWLSIGGFLRAIFIGDFLFSMLIIVDGIIPHRN
jgi:hypothetical protein